MKSMRKSQNSNSEPRFGSRRGGWVDQLIDAAEKIAGADKGRSDATREKMKGLDPNTKENIKQTFIPKPSTTVPQPENFLHNGGTLETLFTNNSTRRCRATSPDEEGNAFRRASRYDSFTSRLVSPTASATSSSLTTDDTAPLFAPSPQRFSSDTVDWWFEPLNDSFPPIPSVIYVPVFAAIQNEGEFPPDDSSLLHYLRIRASSAHAPTPGGDGR